jgi:hypothetical protein
MALESGLMAVSPYSDWRSVEVKQELRAEFKSALEAQHDLLKTAGEGRHEKALLRIDAIEKAAKTFEDHLTRVPTQLDRETERLTVLFDEKLARLNLRLDSFQTQTEAAFAAAREITTAHTNANSAAVTKAEGVVTKEIETIKVLISSTSDALDTKIDNITDRINRGEGVWAGGKGIISIVVGAIGTAALVVTMYANLNRSPVNGTDTKRVDDLISVINEQNRLTNQRMDKLSERLTALTPQLQNPNPR